MTHPVAQYQNTEGFVAAVTAYVTKCCFEANPVF